MPDREHPLSLWGIWWNAILLLRSDGNEPMRQAIKALAVAILLAECRGGRRRTAGLPA